MRPCATSTDRRRSMEVPIQALAAPSCAGLLAAVLAVARFGGARSGFQQLKAVVASELRDAEAHEFGELTDPEPTLIVLHRGVILRGSPK